MKTLLCLSILTYLVREFAEARYKIINGDVVADWASNKFKFVVLLHGEFVCTGSWLGGKHVLTAAHCTCEKEHVDRVTFERVNDKSPNTQDIAIKSQQHNPAFTDCDKGKVDVGIIGLDVSVAILEKEPKPSKQIVKVAMDFGAPPAVGTEANIVGYGLDDPGVLKTGKVKIVVCNPKYKPSVICAKPDPTMKNQKSTEGDSGSPLIIEVGGKYECVGTEAGNDQVKGKPDTYTMMFTSAKENEAFIKKYI